MDEDDEEKYIADFTSKKNQVLLFARDGVINAKDIVVFFPDSICVGTATAKILNRLTVKGMLKRTKVYHTRGMYCQYELTKTGEKKCKWIDKHIIDPDNGTVFYKTRSEAKEEKEDDEKVYFLLGEGYYNRVPVEWKKQDWSDVS